MKKRSINYSRNEMGTKKKIEGRSSEIQRPLLTTTTTRKAVGVRWGYQSTAHGQAQEVLQGMAQKYRKNGSADGGGETAPWKLETGLAVRGPNNTNARATAAGKAAAATTNPISTDTEKQLKQHSNARKNELRACKPWSHLFATVEDHSNSKANETPVGFQEKP